MTQHTHSEHVPGCFRCDLSMTEAAASVALDAGSRDHTGTHTCDGRCAETEAPDGLE